MPLITSANAREMAAKGNFIRWSRKPVPATTEQIPAPPAIVAEKPDDYHSRRLSRVRAQLDSLDSRLEDEFQRPRPDAKTIKAIVEAQMRLSEQERILAGRPMPGSRRPGNERVASRPTIDLKAHPRELRPVVQPPAVAPAPPAEPSPQSP